MRNINRIKLNIDKEDFKKKLDIKDGKDYILTKKDKQDIANSTSNSYADGKVEDSIVDSHTTVAPSGNAVFDALALKAGLGANTFTGGQTLPVGTASAGTAPLYFQSGTNLSSAVAGANEYDGQVFYTTPVNGARGVSPSTMYAIVENAGFSLQTASGVQSAFPSTKDVWTLAANTTYYVEGMYYITKATTALTTAIAFALGGGASITSMRLEVISTHLAVNTTGTANNSTIVDRVASTVVTASSAANAMISFKGLIRMNAGGTVTPQIAWSTTATATPTMAKDSYIRFTPLGTDTNNTVGNVA